MLAGGVVSRSAFESGRGSGVREVALGAVAVGTAVAVVIVGLLVLALSLTDVESSQLRIEFSEEVVVPFGQRTTWSLSDGIRSLYRWGRWGFDLFHCGFDWRSDADLHGRRSPIGGVLIRSRIRSIWCDSRSEVPGVWRPACFHVDPESLQLPHQDRLALGQPGEYVGDLGQ
jgi:hypothetical protein